MLTTKDLAEYDSCAKYCAERGLSGSPGDPLPANISASVFASINYDEDAFRERVREFSYALAMEKSSIPDYSVPVFTAIDETDRNRAEQTYRTVITETIRHWILLRGGEPIKLGNVEFWIESHDLVYSIPSHEWDVDAFAQDFIKSAGKHSIDQFDGFSPALLQEQAS